MINIAIIGSTNGTSIRPAIQKILDGEILGVNIKCVISNRSKSGLLAFARAKNLNAIYLPKKRETPSEKYDSKLCEVLKSYDVDYVFLIGWMRLCTPIFVNSFRNRAINIHPSILPAFAGMMDMDIHTAVSDRGCKYTGATIMFIDEGADTGPIIDQSIVRVENTDTPQDIKCKVQSLEKELIIKTINTLSK